MSGSLRLVDGPDSNEGLVEICIFQFWHPLCDYMFSDAEANVICQWLGYPFVEGMFSSNIQ